MSEPYKSEVAHFREQQALKEESARLALTGYAITARHDFITARVQRGAERILCLIDEGRHAEAQALMNTENWDVEDTEPIAKGKSKQKTRGRKGKSYA
ncbi:MAG TPA: hypothetical protein VKP04_04530 [Ktedonobacteraceae bacterium]|nr:hypothetical protein [Ktedonobacteraceae bacterium]